MNERFSKFKLMVDLLNRIQIILTYNLYMEAHMSELKVIDKVMSFFAVFR